MEPTLEFEHAFAASIGAGSANSIGGGFGSAAGISNFFCTWHCGNDLFGQRNGLFMNGEKVLGTVKGAVADTAPDFVGAMTSGGEVITSVVFENELDAGGGNSLGELVDEVAFRLADTKCGFQLGDMNEDGLTNLEDVQPFVDLLIAGGFLCQGDYTGDGIFNLEDVDPFVADLAGG